MARMLQYAVNTNFNGVNGFGREYASVIYNTKVAATTDTTLVVPSSSAVGQIIPYSGTNPQVLAIINYQAAATVFVAVQTANNGVTTAAPDTSGTFALSSGIINPPALWVNGGNTLHFYAVAQDFVSVEFYFVN